ncbi:hypothetical protein NIES4103_54100 [Nostoc sp. NIES-4103]|nr:hypothetical protein NIES4103_54100 [Nostoc sp. NIES-4103]
MSFTIIFNYLQFIYENIINIIDKFEAPRDYLTAFNICLSIDLAIWNYRNTQEKFAASNYPVLKVELELPPYKDKQKLFPIYPNYKISNISDKKVIDIKIEVKIYCLKNKWKIWKNQWIYLNLQDFDKIDELEPNAKLRFLGYDQEFHVFRGRLGNGRISKEYAEQSYIENIPIQAVINVYYSPVLYQAKKLRASKTYNLILKRASQVDFTQEYFLDLMPNLLKLNIKLFLCIVNQLFVYQNLLSKLELREMVMSRTHYWKLQEIEKSWQFPFKLF